MNHLLILNSGSSSLKFSIFERRSELREICAGNLSGIAAGGKGAGHFKVSGAEVERIDRSQEFADHGQAIDKLLDWLKDNFSKKIDCVGHRVVHGGRKYSKPTRIDDALIEELIDLSRFAPLHLPASINTIKASLAAFPDLPHVACFDTSFHRTMPLRARMLPLTRELFFDDGVEKFGFHGISYEFVIGELKEKFGAGIGSGKVIIAHLGNGCSMTAIENGRSIETTMGFSPTGGLVMGTRSGDLDPGLLTYFCTEKNFSAAQFVDYANHSSGLKGLSGFSSDMKILLERESENQDAKHALEIFCYHARKHIGALSAAMNGLHALVFTGGIGENAGSVRERICNELGFLGISIDPTLNAKGLAEISQRGAPTRVFVIPTNEELMIAKHCLTFL